MAFRAPRVTGVGVFAAVTESDFCREPLSLPQGVPNRLHLQRVRS